MKPDWKDAPEWADYLAIDDDGTWYWYENEPVYHTPYWIAQGGRSEEAQPLPDFTPSHSLEHRPE